MARRRQTWGRSSRSGTWSPIRARTSDSTLQPMGPRSRPFEAGTAQGFLKLFTIDLASGAATNRGLIGSGTLEIDGLTALPREEIVYAVTVSNRLISFRADQPERILSVVSLQGLIAGENVTDIDFRPASGRTVRVDRCEPNPPHRHRDRPDDAARRSSSTRPSLPLESPHGFDFNPAADRLRLVNTSDDNVRYNPLTFAVVARNRPTPTWRSSRPMRTSGRTRTSLAPPTIATTTTAPPRRRSSASTPA